MLHINTTSYFNKNFTQISIVLFLYAVTLLTNTMKGVLKLKDFKAEAIVCGFKDYVDKITHDSS